METKSQLPQLGVRRRAREFAFKALFEMNQRHTSLETVWSRVLEEEVDQETIDFAKKLLLGFEDHREEVDQMLENIISGWSFEQMAKTDLTVLRLAVYEMMFEDTPGPPVIEIAVRIAKKYGGEESGRFVNGVLAKMMHEK